MHWILGQQSLEDLLTNLEKCMDENVIVVGDFNMPLSSLDRPTWQNISKDTRALTSIKEKIKIILLHELMQRQLWLILIHGLKTLSVK